MFNSSSIVALAGNYIIVDEKNRWLSTGFESTIEEIEEDIKEIKQDLKNKG